MSTIIFAEGLSPRSASEFVLLTWKARIIYTIDRQSMKVLSENTLDSQIAEGWGVTADESQVNSNGYYQLYITDGSEYVYLVDGESLKVTSKVRV